MKLSELAVDEYARITAVGGEGSLRQHFLDMVLIPGCEVALIKFAPMGDPIEIEYTLTFYSETLGDRSRIPQEAAKKVLAISLVIIVVGAILNHFVKRRRR